MVGPGAHVIAGWYLHKFDTAAAYVTPTILRTSTTWDSESCADHPDPARGQFDLFVPKVAVPAMGLDLGTPIRTFVWAQGLNATGTGAVETRHVAYFEGEVDGIAMERSPGKAAMGMHTAVLSSPAPTPNDGTVTVGIDTAGGPVVVTNNADVDNTIEFTVRVTMPATFTGGAVRVAAIISPWAVSDTHVNSGGGFARTNKVTGLSPGATSFNVRVRAPSVWANATRKIIVLAMEENRGRPDGYRVTVTGSDYLAKLGRLSVGDTPWPYKQAFTRIEQDLMPLAAAAGIPIDRYPYREGINEPGGWDLMWANYVKPMDVDHRSALDIYRRTVAACGRVALGLAGRVGISWGLTPTKTITVSGGVASLAPERAWTSEIPSSAVPDVQLNLTTDRVATRVSASWFLPGDAYNYATNPYDLKEVTYQVTHPTAVARYGVVDRSIETDQFTTRTDWLLPNIAANLVAKIDLMLAEQAEPEWYFGDDVRIIPRDLDQVRGLAELIDNASRFGRAIRLIGPLPDGLADEHRVKGGKFGWDGKRWRLELDPEPVNYSGVEAATFNQAANRADFTIGSGTGITINDLRSVKL